MWNGCAGACGRGVAVGAGRIGWRYASKAPSEEFLKLVFQEVMFHSQLEVPHRKSLLSLGKNYFIFTTIEGCP